MKVLFSNPPYWPDPATADPEQLAKGLTLGAVRAGSRWPHTIYIRSSPDKYVFLDYLPYPFFMGYATTYAGRETGAKTTMRDSIALRESYDSYFKHLQEEKYDVIIIESATPSWEHDGQLIRKIKKMLPDTRIALAGPISSKASKILEDFPIVACIKGEYEKGSVKVIQGAEGVLESNLLTLEEMNAAPYPYYDDTIAHRYWDGNPMGQIAPHAHVWSSRGCPFKCIFCVWPATMTGDDPYGDNKRSVRHYSPDYMQGFLEDIVGRYKFKSIYFDDDTFNLGNKHVLNMCKVMEKINVPWSAMCRADTCRLESWQIMKDAGCFGVKIGIESGNQWVVDNIVNKHLDLDYARKAILECKRVGITVHGTFTYGLPGETREQMLDTKKFIASLPFDTYQESGTAVIEGTPLENVDTEAVHKNFPGTKTGSPYEISTDGGKKWRELAQTLRDA
ncbi:MAG: radical SAM protein [Alphaproteobacteria bacterium]|nr:radical SAM protein [Alphaproteobacteria bacterium]